MFIDYQHFISIERLFQAWHEFRRGKRKRPDVQLFERNLEDNLFNLHKLLVTKTYRHGFYSEFYVNDPKRRHIHKASIRDRIVHHLLYAYLYELFDKHFIYDSYSCRIAKGTHRGVKRLAFFARKVSKNYTIDCFALKCDIRKFFASMDHKVLLCLLRRKIQDRNVIWLLRQIIESFSSEAVGKGIPLGNLTSQVFANIYMNELDQFIKHRLKVKYYLRYADDFIILDSSVDNLLQYINEVRQVLNYKLKLDLNVNKINIQKLAQGVDFLGYIVFPNFILPRFATKKRMIKKLDEKAKKFFCGEIKAVSFRQAYESYFGYLSHTNARRLERSLKLSLPDL